MSLSARELRESVGPYRLIRAIGAGGSARIDLARIDRAYNFQRHVVVKRPLEHLRGDPNVAASLRREARIGGRLRHPNLVAVLDAGTHDGYDYLVLEYIHGASLRKLMETETGGTVRAVPLSVALVIAIDIARGLHQAHELCGDDGAPLGLVHRDVSPGNVLLGIDGAVKVADFGIAKETRVQTLSGSMHGTVTYMAPEQCRGHAFDRRADIFSLGVILYELVTRRRLFWADNDVASLHRVLSGEIVAPRQIDPSISPALEQIVMTAVAHDPDRRFETAKQLADALEGLAVGEGHVLGARQLAHTLEEGVGAKDAPWIAAKTIVEPPRAEEPLVQVIEATAAEPDAPAEHLVTFGPSDRRDVEEGTVLTPVPMPMAAARRSAMPVARRRSRVVPVVVVLGAIVGVAIAVGITSRGSSTSTSTSTTANPTPTPTPTPNPSPTPNPNPNPNPKADTDTATDSASDTDTASATAADTAADTATATDSGKATHHHHRRHRGSASGSGSVSGSGSASVAATGSGSAKGAKPADVEWKPTLFFPGSGSAK